MLTLCTKALNLQKLIHFAIAVLISKLPLCYLPRKTSFGPPEQVHRSCNRRTSINWSHVFNRSLPGPSTLRPKRDSVVQTTRHPRAHGHAVLGQDVTPTTCASKSLVYEECRGRRRSATSDSASPNS